MVQNLIQTEKADFLGKLFDLRRCNNTFKGECGKIDSDEYGI